MSEHFRRGVRGAGPAGTGASASVLELAVCYSWGRAADDNTAPYFQRPDGTLVFRSLKNLGDGQPGSDCEVLARFDQGFARGVRR